MDSLFNGCKFALCWPALEFPDTICSVCWCILPFQTSFALCVDRSCHFQTSFALCWQILPFPDIICTLCWQICYLLAIPKPDGVDTDNYDMPGMQFMVRITQSLLYITFLHMLFPSQSPCGVYDTKGYVGCTNRDWNIPLMETALEYTAREWNVIFYITLDVPIETGIYC